VKTFDLFHFFGDRAACPGLHFASVGLNRSWIKACEEKPGSKNGAGTPAKPTLAFEATLWAGPE
jgi:hypothetical protein